MSEQKQELKLPHLNDVTVVGRLVDDPHPFDVKDSYGCGFAVAVNRRSNGRVFTVYVSCVAWGDVAKACIETLQKGAPILVRGSLSNDRTTAKKLQVSASSVEFLMRAPKPAEVPAEAPAA